MIKGSPRNSLRERVWSGVEYRVKFGAAEPGPSTAAHSLTLPWLYELVGDG
jgi:hypothetical protein